MKLTKSKTTGQYSVKFMTNSGKHVSKPLGTKNKEEAERLVCDAKIEELEALAKAGALQRDAIASIVAGRNMKIPDAIKEWKICKKNLAQSANTIYLQETMLNHFISESGLLKKGIGDITPELIRAWLNAKDGVSLSQREQRKCAIRSFFDFAVAAGLTIRDPSKMVSIDKSKLTHKQKESRAKTMFTEKEYDKLIEHAPYFFKQASALCWWTGLRISDVCNLEWDSFDPEKKTLTIHTQKKDKRVCLPIDEPLIGGGILMGVMQQIDFDDPSYCFPIQRDWMNSPKSRSKLSLYFRRLLQRLELFEEGKGWHSLRRSFVTRCKIEGKKLEDIAIWVGHSDVQTTERYDLSEARV